MKRGTFKKPTPEKLAELNEKKRERQLSKLKEKKPLKTPNLARGGMSRRTPKRKKDGSLTKAEEIRKLKKKLWPIFSKYIRKSWADETGFLTTVDGVIVHWQECDCGHLRHNTERNALLGGNELWFYENNFAPQSNQGNRNNADDSAQKYMLWAVKTHGVDEVDKMMRMRNLYKLWTLEELEAKYQHYKSKFESL